MRQALGGKAEGLGVELVEHNNGLAVHSVMPNSPAEKNGIKPKDIILSVNGTELKNLDAEEAANLLIADEGEELTLLIRRKKCEDKIYKIKIEVFEENPVLLNPVVKRERIPQEILYIRIDTVANRNVAQYFHIHRLSIYGAINGRPYDRPTEVLKRTQSRKCRNHIKEVKNMRRFILTFIAIISICATYAQTLDECRQLAREHYPEIRQYDLINATEQYNLSNAARAWIPQIKLSAQASYQSATPTYPDAFRAFISANGIETDGIHKDQYKVSIDITQNIWDGGQSRADKSLAQAEASEQRSRTDVSLYQLQSRVDDLYFGILLLDEKVSQTITLIEVLESNLKRVQTCFDNGTAQQSDIDIIEAELLTVRQSLQQVEASRANYRQMLEIFIGKNLTHDKLEQPDMNEPTCRVSARPELTLFDAQQRKLTHNGI